MKTKLIIITLSVFALMFLSACTSSSTPGPADALAECMTESGAVMYGTEWCPHCKNQKETFGNSFKLINYVDCDKNKNACINAGVRGYPTWQIQGANYEGSKSLYELSQLTGCSLTGEERKAEV